MWITLTKLNLIPENFDKAAFGLFGKAFGIDENALKDLPEEESVTINSNNVLGISEKMKTGKVNDDRLCYKLYFNSKDFWVIKDDSFSTTFINSILN